MLYTICPEVTASLIGTLVAALIAVIVPLAVLRATHREASQAQLHRDLMELNRLSLDHPYLEKTKFIKEFAEATPKKRASKEEFIRYDSYCSIWFNFLQLLAEHYAYDRGRIERFLDIREIVQIHAAWWSVPENNSSLGRAYPDKFHSLIQEYLP